VNVHQAIKNRYSVRSYKSKEIPEEKLEKVLEAARLAPSGHNSQPWKFVVVKDFKKKNRLAEASGQSFIAEAPIIIAAVALKPKDVFTSEVKGAEVNLAIAADHMTLAAVEENLGTCWIGAFTQSEVKRILKIPENYKVIALLPVGFPDEEQKAKTRKDLNEITCEDTFKE